MLLLPVDVALGVGLVVHRDFVVSLRLALAKHYCGSHEALLAAMTISFRPLTRIPCLAR